MQIWMFGFPALQKGMKWEEVDFNDCRNLLQKLGKFSWFFNILGNSQFVKPDREIIQVQKGPRLDNCLCLNTFLNISSCSLT